MTLPKPPEWLESLLILCLPPRDRETISGDLLEEYREEQLPRRGSLRANVWFVRQSVSFLWVRSFGAPLLKAALTWTSLFTAAAGGWLGVMEQALKHAGYAGRIETATFILIESMATLLFVVLGRRVILRVPVLIGAVAVGMLGVSALQRNLASQHFEGFVILIASALIAQSLLTIAVVLRAGREKIL